MSDSSEPGACEACGRPLPPQDGRGRRRRYCDATCRSRARRQRADPGRTALNVKENLTLSRRHGTLDNVWGLEPASAEARLASAIGRLGASRPLEGLGAARELAAAAGDMLQGAVDAARAAGHSWREIGAVLGTSRQAAFQRFGHPVDPRTGALMSQEVPPDAVEQAVTIVAAIARGDLDQACADFSPRISEAVTAGQISDAWARTAAMVGSYEGMGEPFARRAADTVVVRIPLRFEAGEVSAQIVFDAGGKVAGLWLRPE